MTRLTVPDFGASPRNLMFVGSIVILICGFLLIKTFWGDPSIYFSYARNIASGDFFSYNISEFSSGSTSPLWALILSIPFLFPPPVTIVLVKIFGIIFTLSYFLLSVILLKKFFHGRSTLLPFGSALYLLALSFLYGIMCYESALLINLILLSVFAGNKFSKEMKKNHTPNAATSVLLSLIWSMLLVTRPDTLILVIAQSAALFFSQPRSIVGVRRFLLLLLASSIPSLLYYGYSYFTLGSFSVSSACRSFGLKESSSHLIGMIYYSQPSLLYLILNLPALILAFLGVKKMRNGTSSWLALYATIVGIAYFLLLTFISPVSTDLPRYYLPMTALLLIPIGIALRDLFTFVVGRNMKKLLVIVIFSYFIILPIAYIGSQVYTQAMRGYTFDEIMEKEAVEKINSLATKGDIVLAYEAQDRFYLRNDISILSLDGITDGKVYDFMVESRLYDFLIKEKPRYWIANDAVLYRPYLRKSPLFEIYSQFARHEADRVQYKNIVFNLIAQRDRPIPKSFAGWRFILRIDYDQLAYGSDR